MAEFILRVEQAGKTLAEWRVGDSPIELVISDPESGREVARLTASPTETTESIDDEPSIEAEDHTDAGGDDLTLPLPEDGVVVASESTSDDLELDSEPASAAGAEVWIRRDGDWQQAGWLVPRQRVSTQGGWIKQAKDGRLLVLSGKKLRGTATLPDGRTVEIGAGAEALSFPAGASVLLGAGPHGIYVRSAAWAGRSLGPVTFAG